MKTKLVLFLAVVIAANGFAQNNLLDTSTWTVGTGNVSGFTVYGPSAESERILDTDGWGNSSVVWVSLPDPATNQDGGYYSSYKTIDPTKTYRLTTWMKKTGSNAGNSYFGLHSRSGSTQSTQRLNGTTNTNPYFWIGDLPQLDKWYMIVGFIHPNSYSGPSLGGMYDGDTGELVAGVTVSDFKFAPDATTLRNRALLWKSLTPTDRQYYWSPTIYEVNGQEPDIATLTDTGGNTGGGDGVWNASGDDINYTTGNVGIGTESPDATLTVKGNIHTQEVKVDLQGAVAPDYVFYEDYPLRTLEEVQQHIDEFGHLPNIPSAKEMQTNGVKLKEMNLKLLEKIEELTLYILELEKRVQGLEKKK